MQTIKKLFSNPLFTFVFVALSYFLFLPYVLSFLYSFLHILVPSIFVGKFKLIEENLSFISLLIQDLGSLIIISFFVIKIIKKKELKNESKKCFNIWTLKQGLITLVLLYLVNFAISMFLPEISTGANQENVNSIINSAPILSFFSVVILAPIIEELIFRYLLITPLIKKNKEKYKFWAIGLSAFLFGFVHLISSIQENTFLTDLPNLAIYIGMGAVLSYKYVETENIYIPILGHLFNNLLAFIFSLFI